MTRKSRREIEDALNRLQTDDCDADRSDAARGVTAPFVTYEEGTPDLPSDVTEADVVEQADGTTLRVVEDVDEPAEA
jgi:hypothetical protein